VKYIVVLFAAAKSVSHALIFLHIRTQFSIPSECQTRSSIKRDIWSPFATLSSEKKNPRQIYCPSPLHLTTSKAMVIVQRLRGNIIRTG